MSGTLETLSVHSRQRPESGVSRALRRVDAPQTHPEKSKPWPIPKTENMQSSYAVRLVTCAHDRLRALRLVHREFRRCGYTSDSESTFAKTTPFQDNTLTILIENQNGRAVATVSLIYDGPQGLPCDEIYADELNQLRSQGRQVAEVTRLAMDPQLNQSKSMLVTLFNFIYIHARRIKNFDDFVIEVNPRHVAYYRRLLQFEAHAPERTCPRVQGAPAILMRLDLSVPEAQIAASAGKAFPHAAQRPRHLYPYFLPYHQERAAEAFLSKSAMDG